MAEIEEGPVTFPDLLQTGRRLWEEIVVSPHMRLDAPEGKKAVIEISGEEKVHPEKKESWSEKDSERAVCLCHYHAITDILSGLNGAAYLMAFLEKNDAVPWVTDEEIAGVIVKHIEEDFDFAEGITQDALREIEFVREDWRRIIERSDKLMSLEMMKRIREINEAMDPQEKAKMGARERLTERVNRITKRVLEMHLVNIQNKEMVNIQKIQKKEMESCLSPAACSPDKPEGK